MKELFEQTFRISTYDLTPREDVRLTTLADFFQEVATQQATQLGFGYHDLQAKGVFWVLSRMRIRVNRYPAWDEEVKVETWPNGIEKIFGIRDSRIKDKEGKIIAEASTAWLVVDIKTRRPLRATDIYQKYAEKVDSVFDRPVEKIKLPENLRSSDKIKVQFSDIDIIGHVNNVKYIEWSLDQLLPDKILKHPVKEIEINFLHESMHGDVIDIRIDDSEKGRAFVSGVRVSDEKDVYRMEINFFAE